MALMKICSRCGKKVPYDSECKCMVQARKDNYKEYRKRRKDTKEQSFYNSVAWKRVAKYIGIKYNNCCLMCLMLDNKVESYKLIHHIIELKVDWEKRLSIDNLIPLCTEHHNQLHSNYDNKKIEMLIDLVKKYQEEYED